MTTVERVRSICKDKKIPIFKLEEELHFGNGYLNPKKIQNIPSDRLSLIAKYLDVPVEYLMTGEESEPPTDAETAEVLRLLRQASGAKKRAAIAAAIAVLKTKDD